MVGQWLYWMRYHPKYGIVESGPIRITKVDYTYQITLPIVLTYENRDDMEEMLINCEQLCLNVSSRMTEGRKRSYNLTYSAGEPVWRLLPSARLEKTDYTLTTTSSANPRLGNTGTCRVVNIGIASLKGIKKVLKSRSFEVEIDWGDLK